MWQYKTSVVWKDGKIGESHSSGNLPIEMSTPPDFGGPRNRWSPEQLLTSSVAACIMTTALFFFEKGGVELHSYMSNATGTMEKTSQGLSITKMQIDVTVTSQSAEQEALVRRAMKSAKKNCPISNALKCPVEMRLQVESVEAS